MRIRIYCTLHAGINVGWGVTGTVAPLAVGNVSAIDARLEPLSPNFFNYQTGVLLHELGHQLGLCHPTQHDGMTIVAPGFARCAAIPVAERDPGVSAMGAPSENPGPLGEPAAIVNALRRPVDFTPGQWLLVNVGAGLAP
jgi:hypothetical protein